MSITFACFIILCRDDRVHKVQLEQLENEAQVDLMEYQEQVVRMVKMDRLAVMEFQDHQDCL